MIDHVELNVADRTRAVAFFRGALAPLGYALHVEHHSSGFGTDIDHLDFWLRDGGPATPRPHVAFNCATRALVDAAHAAALASGGVERAAPALLPHIHASYYAGFVHDPDGHNIEFVCHAAADDARGATPGVIVGARAAILRIAFAERAPCGTTSRRSSCCCCRTCS